MGIFWYFKFRGVFHQLPQLPFTISTRFYPIAQGTICSLSRSKGFFFQGLKANPLEAKGLMRTKLTAKADFFQLRFMLGKVTFIYLLAED